MCLLSCGCGVAKNDLGPLLAFGKVVSGNLLLFEKSNGIGFTTAAPIPLCFVSMVSYVPVKTVFLTLRTAQLEYIHLNVTCGLVKEELFLRAGEKGDVRLL